MQLLKTGESNFSIRQLSSLRRLCDTRRRRLIFLSYR